MYSLSRGGSARTQEAATESTPITSPSTQSARDVCPTPSGRVLSPVLTRNLPTHVLARKSCASCTRALGITPRATRRAQPHAPPAPSSRPPVPVVPARGRRRHAARPPAHTRAGECWALVGSGGSRAHRASSTCAGHSRRATARRSSSTTPPAPDGEPPGRRTPSAARPPAVPPDLDLRHQRRHEEDLLLCGEGAVGGDGACAAMPQLSEVGEGT